MNYNHLFYFWTVARTGSISRAAAELKVSQPTISEQLRKLEETLGTRLFERAGRGLRLTEPGQNVFGYAGRIFQLGQEMTDSLTGQAPIATQRLAVGITHSVPAQVAHQVLAPAMKAKTRIRIACIQETSESLYAKLATRQIDVILSDTPMSANFGVRAYPKMIARSGVTFLRSRNLRPNNRSFPANLEGLPFLMPTGTKLSQGIEEWFRKWKVRPQIVGEVSSSELLWLWGRDGVGAIAVPTLVERGLRGRDGLEVLGRTRETVVEYFAITADRKFKHPGIVALINAEKRH